MSLLSDFWNWRFFLMDSPMFQELVENIKNNRTDSANKEFDYSLNLSSKPQNIEMRYALLLDLMNKIIYNLNSINNVNIMSKHVTK